MGVDPEAVIEFIRPSRKLRRELDGKRCAVCHLRLHFSEAGLLRLPYGTEPAHDACFELMAESFERLEEVLHDEAAEAGGPPGEADQGIRGDAEGEPEA